MVHDKAAIVRTSYELEQQHAESLRAVAGSLGFVQTRGAGAGLLPNISAFLRALAEHAERDRGRVVEALRAIGVEAQSGRS